MRRHAESAGDVASPSGCGPQGGLRRRRPPTLQGVERDRNAAQARQPLREHRRLVEAARDEAPPVQRRRHDQHIGQRIGRFGRPGAVEQRRRGAREPLRQRRRKVQAVGVFEPGDQTPGDIAVAHGGARPVERRLGARAGAAHRPRPDGVIERQAAGVAHRIDDEIHRAPARGAQAARRVHRLAARHAQMRQHKVQRPCKPMPQRPAPRARNSRHRPASRFPLPGTAKTRLRRVLVASAGAGFFTHSMAICIALRPKRRIRDLCAGSGFSGFDAARRFVCSSGLPVAATFACGSVGFSRARGGRRKKFCVSP